MHIFFFPFDFKSDHILSYLQPIFFAASNGHTPLVRLLVKSGGDPKAKCNFGETPYSMACSAGHTATADLLESLSDDKLSTSPPIKGSTEKTCEL